jgi:hypothetical protein
MPKTLSTTLFAATIAVAAVSIATSLYLVLTNHMDPPYWDQWEFFRTAALQGNATRSLTYIFGTHNAHIIATSKFLYAINLSFFRGTNIFLISCIIITNIIIATTITLVASKRLPIRGNVIFFFVSTMILLSLAQWENLLWAFQPHFSLVAVFSIGSLYFLNSALDKPEHVKFREYVVFSALLALGVYSLGNGFTVIVGMVFILAIARQSFARWVLVFFTYAVIAAPFLWAARHGHAVGDLSLRTPANLVYFCLRMIGNPFAMTPNQAVYIGAGLSVFYASVLYLTVIRPLIRRHPIDGNIIVLIAVAGFLMGTVVVTAWSRVSLGPTAGMASRYATPMLILMVVVSGALWRHVSLNDEATGRSQLRALAGAAAILAAGLWSHVKPTNFLHIDAHVSRVQQAAYFVASDVPATDYLQHLYPDAAAIRPAIAFLKSQRLSIFAENFGLAMPKADLVRLTIGPLPDCTRAAVDGLTRLETYGWSAVGWVAQTETGRRPEWVMAFSSDNLLLGFTRPYMHRRDVVAAIGASARFRGFIVPIARTSPIGPPPDGVWLMAVFSRAPAACRIAIGPALP